MFHLRAGDRSHALDAQSLYLPLLTSLVQRICIGTPTANGACGACGIRASRSEIHGLLKKTLGDRSALKTIDATPTL